MPPLEAASTADASDPLAAQTQLSRDDGCDATHAAAALPFPSIPVTSHEATRTWSRLPPDSYTAHRLSHATPQHLHLTTRRVFVGPVPHDWLKLKENRRGWLKRQLGIHYSSKAATFTAQPGTSRARRVTGLGEDEPRGHTRQRSRTLPGKTPDLHITDNHADHPRPSTSASLFATHGAFSFPQPAGLDPDTGIDSDDEEQGLEEIREDDAEAAEEAAATPAVLSPVATKDMDLARTPRPGFLRTASHKSDKSATGPSMSALLRMEPAQRPGLDRRTSGSSKRADGGEPEATSASSVSFVTASEGVDEDDDDHDGSDVATIRGADPEPITDQRVEAEQLAEDDTPTETGIPPPDPNDVDTASSTINGQLSPLQSHGFETDERRTSAVNGGSAYSGTPIFSGKQSSSTSLLPKLDGAERGSSSHPRPVSPKSKQSQPVASGDGANDASFGALESSKASRVPAGVTFSIPEDAETREFRIRARLAQLKQRKTYKRFRRGRAHVGEIVKFDNMLVRVEATTYDLPGDFDENSAQKIEVRTLDKWKEFLVVCRETDNDDAPFELQMYKSRVISAVEKANDKKSSAHTIRLDRTTTRVNLFSPLDKTMVIWHPRRVGTKIILMQAKSGADSMEWYTFLRNVLGQPRTNLLQINVPDLGVSLRLDNPFEQLESVRDMAALAEGNDEAIMRTMMAEQAVAANIISRCVEMLRKSEQWTDILDAWMGHSRIGLAWKRYDRLEWIYGANEQKMFGTIGMEKSYDLELRPKQHYPTTAKDRATGQTLTEPPPVEGSLIRLTSQKGRDQRLGRSFSKRLYFSTHSNFLVFNRPDKAEPPPPPSSEHWDQHDLETVPSAEAISKQYPLIFSVNPYPIKNEYIEWLQPGEHLSDEDRERLDRNACDERERSIDNLLNCEGMIDLVQVEKVRRVKKSAAGDILSDADDAGAGDEHSERDRAAALFELVLKNKLVVRLQAYDSVTAAEWVQRLRALVRYWQCRAAADIELYKSVRHANLQTMKIDEAGESAIGQFARKWEVTNSYASPELYHMCGIASCRSIALSGILYRKPRLRAPFERNLVVLAHGHLLMLQDGLRGASGALLPHSHHERVASLDLKDCYIYSGLVTELDLAGVESTAALRPGHFSLPRMYRQDGWSSNDEAPMTCFVVWHGTRRSWFRAPPTQASGARKTGKGLQEGGRVGQLKLVRSLGVTGRSVVFLTRSRAERDHWVLSVGMEIERLQREVGGVEVRVA